MFKRSTVITINELGKRFVLVSNLSKMEFNDGYDQYGCIASFKLRYWAEK